MAMDFFEAQDRARGRTALLVTLLVVAVLIIIALVHTVLVLALFWMGREEDLVEEFSWSLLWNPKMLGLVGGGTIAVVGGASLYKLLQLRGGGDVLAGELGGERVDPETADTDQQRLLNVVEEMAIASGTAVPTVYELSNERSINAFAAGHDPDDAVIGVTRGAVKRLARPELQGVIAHEFSHILNGDMRMNVRLIGVLHGILVIGIIGSVILRVAFYGSLASHHHARGGGDRNKSPIQLAVVGLALMAIGYVGTFFGEIIKAAVSRQREYLADAAAVQFTRHPEGLAGALKKIGGLKRGARIENGRAEEASHMFFGQGVSGLASLFATHPPLTKRVRAIQPDFAGAFEAQPEQAEDAPRDDDGPAAMSGFAGGGAAAEAEAAGSSAAEEGGAGGAEGTVAEAVARVGHPTEAHLKRAAALLRAIPEPAKKAARTAYGARGVVLALLLDGEASVRQKQLQHLEQEAEAQVLKETQRVAKTLAELEPAARLPLLDLAVPALRELSPTQYEQFAGHVDALVRADERLGLFEWTLHQLLQRHVAPHVRGQSRNEAKGGRGLDDHQRDAQRLLSTLAWAGQQDGEAADRAYKSGARHLGLDASLAERSECGLKALDTVLPRLRVLAGRHKRTLLEACGNTIAADQAVTVREGELLRAVADALGCPMPPLLPGQFRAENAESRDS